MVGQRENVLAWISKYLYQTHSSFLYHDFHAAVEYVYRTPDGPFPHSPLDMQAFTGTHKLLSYTPRMSPLGHSW